MRLKINSDLDVLLQWEYPKKGVTKLSLIIENSEGNRMEFNSIAKCHKNDIFNKRIARRLTLSRVFKDHLKNILNKNDRAYLWYLYEQEINSNRNHSNSVVIENGSVIWKGKNVTIHYV